MVRVETTISWEGPSCERVTIILRIGAWEKIIYEGDTISTIGGCNFINGGGVEKLNSIGVKLGCANGEPWDGGSEWD